MKSKWMKCCAVLMGVLLAVSPLTALAEEPQNPAATAGEKTGAGENAENETMQTEGNASETEETFPTFTVRGQEYTLDSGSWYDSGKSIQLKPDYTDFKNYNTAEDYKTIVEQFLKIVEERPGVTYCSIYCNMGENGAATVENLQIPISEDTAWPLIQELKDKGVSFVVIANSSWSGNDRDPAFIRYSDITKPTTLGFATYDYLKNIHVDFYDAGYSIMIDEIEYTMEGTPTVINANSGKRIENVCEKSGSTVKIEMKVNDPGLYYIMPEASAEDTSQANVSLKSNGEAAKVEAVISGAVATAGDKENVKVDITEDKDASGKAVNPQIGKKVFEQLNQKKDQDAAVTFSYGDLTYKFAASDITDPDAAAVTLGATEATDEVKKTVGSNVAYAIDFAHSGKLPGKATVTIPVDLEDGPYTWCYVNDANQLTEGKLVNVKDKTVEVPLEHCSTYALVAGDVTGSTGGSESTGGSGSTGGSESTGGNESTGGSGSTGGSESSSVPAGSSDNSGSHSGSTNLTKVTDSTSIAGSVQEGTGKNVQSHTTFWTLSDSYKQSLIDKIDKTKAPGQVKWFYDVTVDEVNFPLTFTVNVKGLNGKKATVVHFVDGNTPEYITPTVKGDQVTFMLNSLSPVAIVVDSSQAATLTSPKTGDSSNSMLPFAVLLLAVAGISGCIVYSRRKKEA